MQSAARSAPPMPRGLDPPKDRFIAAIAADTSPPYARTDTTCAYSCRATELSRPAGTLGEM